MRGLRASLPRQAALRNLLRDGATNSLAAPPSLFPQRRSPGPGEHIQGGKRTGDGATALPRPRRESSARRRALGLDSLPLRPPAFRSLPAHPALAVPGRCSAAPGRKPPSKPLSALTDPNSGPTRLGCQVCVFAGDALSPNATCRPFSWEDECLSYHPSEFSVKSFRW